MRILRSAAISLMLGASALATLSAATQAQVVVGVSVMLAPPALPVYVQPPIPGLGYIWTPGYWAWSGVGYFWVPGTWVLAPRPGLLWTPGYWGWSDGVYIFHAGYWGPTIGFYGGVNYGFGYAGIGYQGGYWSNGAFFYNRSVNNISNVQITNVYNKTVVVNQTTNVSYNGGKGGVAATPTPQQLAAAKQPHIPPTPLQAQHIAAASKNPALLATNNHGHPAIAATSHPGVFRGPGVVPAHAAVHGLSKVPGGGAAAGAAKVLPGGVKPNQLAPNAAKPVTPPHPGLAIHAAPQSKPALGQQHAAPQTLSKVPNGGATAGQKKVHPAGVKPGQLAPNATKPVTPAHPGFATHAAPQGKPTLGQQKQLQLKKQQLQMQQQRQKQVQMQRQRQMQLQRQRQAQMQRQRQVQMQRQRQIQQEHPR